MENTRITVPWVRQRKKGEENRIFNDKIKNWPFCFSYYSTHKPAYSQLPTRLGCREALASFLWAPFWSCTHPAAMDQNILSYFCSPPQQCLKSAYWSKHKQPWSQTWSTLNAPNLHPETLLESLILIIRHTYLGFTRKHTITRNNMQETTSMFQNSDVYSH